MVETITQYRAPTPMTPAEIAALAEVERKATPGEWFQSGPPWYRDGSIAIAASVDGNVAAPVLDCNPFDLRTRYAGPFALSDAEDDAAFIAAARNAVPRLIAMLAARDAEIAGLREALKEAIDVLDGMADDEINLEFLPRLREGGAQGGRDDG